MNHAAARQLAGNTAWSTLAHLMMRGGLVVAFMILSHRLTTEAFAQLSYFHLTLGYVAAFAMLGLSATTVRTFASFNSPRREYEGGAELVIFLTIAAIASFGAWLWGEPRIGGLPSWTFAAALPLLIVGGFPQGILNGRQDFRSMALAAIVAAVVAVGLSVLANGEQAILLAFMGIAGAYLAKLLGETGMALPVMRRSSMRIRKPTVSDLGKVLAAMSWLGIAAITNAVGMWALASWMRSDLDDASFGTFAVGIQWYAIGMFLAANITRVLMPMQVQLATTGQDASSKLRLIAIGGGAAVAVTICMAIFAFLFRDVVASFYDAKLTNLGLAIVAFTAAAATAAPLNIIGNFAIAEGRERLWSFSSFAWLAFAVLGVVISATLGSIGGAVSLAIANIGQGLVILGLLHREGILR